MSNATSGRVVVITGGTRGVGAATVEQFLAAGDKVVSISKNAADPSKQKSGCTYLQADVSSPEQLHGAAAQVLAKFGRIDVWINNAGYGKLIPFADGDETAWADIFNVNFWGVVHGCRAALRAMKDSGGCIINVGSLAGLMAPRNHSAYAVSKASVMALTRSLAVEYGKQNVRVNAVVPGPIQTEGFIAAGGDPVKRAQTIPTGKMIQPEEIARVCAFLAEPMTSLTGQVIVVDGGSQAAGCYV